MINAKKWTEYSLDELIFECLEEYSFMHNTMQILDTYGNVVDEETVLNTMRTKYGYEVFKFEDGRFIVNDDNLIL